MNNPDGFGVMMPTDKGGVHVHRIMPESADDCKKVIDKYGDRPMGIHFRLATHGEVDKSQCHPFPVLTPKTHGRSIYLMHNGILPNALEFDKTKSDTWHFVEYVLRPILADCPDLIYDRDFQDMLEDMIGSNKFLILDGDTGEMIKINESVGTEADGLWLSNTYSLRRGKGMDYDPVSGDLIPEKKATPWARGYTKPAVAYSSNNWRDDDYAHWDSFGGYYSNFEQRWIDSAEIKADAAAAQKVDEEEKDIVSVDPTPWVNDGADDVEIDWAQDQAAQAEQLDPAMPGNHISTDQILNATDLEIYQWMTSNPDGMADLLISLVR